MLLGAGTCSVTAIQAGNATFGPATPVTKNFTVNVAKPSGTVTAGPGSPLTTGTNPWSVAVEDFNGDGIQDLAVVNNGSNNISVLLGNGAGGFALGHGAAHLLREHILTL